LTGRAEQGRPPVSETFPHIRIPWKAIAAELRDAIAKGDFVPGQPAGPVSTLAELYGVNHKTAGKALRAVAAEGLIELVPGRGYLVL
jgi:DNA-binding GntR family transcriptional regulator